MGAADPARGQALAVHRGDDRLDVLPADRADLPVADRGVHVGAEHRLIGTDAAVRAEVVREPGPGFGAERRRPGLGVDEDVGLLVVLDLEQEVLSLAQVVAEGLLPLPARPPAWRAVADDPRVRAVVPAAAAAALDDAGHEVTPPGSGAIPPRAARGTAGTGRPGTPEGPTAASSRRPSSSARPGSQPAHRPTGAGSSRPREPGRRPGAGPMHARLPPHRQARPTALPRPSRQPPTAPVKR